MNTLRAYLLRQIIASLLMTMAVFTFVLLMGNVLKEMLGLLIQRQVSAGLAFEAVGLLIPFVLVFALPMAMLTATLLVFGRFSADQELTAARAGGISLLSLVPPVFLLSLLLCVLSAAVNLEIAPRCRVAYKELLFKLSVELSANVQLPEGRFIQDFKGYVIYIGKNREQKLEDVIIYDFQSNTNGSTTVHASRGQFHWDAPKRKATLDLFEARMITRTESRTLITTVPKWEIIFDLAAKTELTNRPPISDMTFSELRTELRNLEHQFSAAPASSPAGTVISAERRPEPTAQIRELTSPIRVQIHRLAALSFACFGFTLVGIPLGIRVQRRETNVSFFIALLLVAVYYGLVSFAQTLEARPDYFPHLIMWIPNLVFLIVGAGLLRRANRGI